MSKINDVADALESGQYKYALQVCNKSIKKSKSAGEVSLFTVTHPVLYGIQVLTFCKAYKAVTLIFLDNGKDEEAIALINQVRKTNPVDRAEVNQLYEEAAKKLPKDEDFNRNWFHQMILRSDIDGARKAAMVLNKLPNQCKYFYWLLTAWKISSNHNPSPQVRTLSKAMATKLVNHVLSTPKILPETTGEVLLLLSAAPPGPALNFLQGDGKRWTSDIEVRRIYIDLLQDAGKYDELKGFCEDEVDQGADDWKVVKGWVDAHIGFSNSNPTELNSLRKLQSKLDAKYLYRNFALGSLYLSANCPNTLQSPGIPIPREECVRYFGQFGRKAACFTDIQSYVAVLSKDDQIQFLKDIEEKLEADEKPYDKITREINVLKFDYMLRIWTTDKPGDLVRCWNLYIKGTKLSEPTDDIDNFPGDDALLLACYTLVKAYVSTKHAKYLLQAALWLELGLEKSRHNFQFKLLVIRVYHLLGATIFACTWFTSLQLKHMQFDTLAHHHISRISTTYPDEIVLQQISLSRYIYSTSEEEIPPQVFNSFMQGSYHNAPDFWDLWMRLRHSLSRAIIARERELVARHYQESDPPEEITGELFDQRDLTVMMNCELTGNPSPEDFTRLGPLQKAAAMKVLAIAQRMLYSLDNPKSSELAVMYLEDLKALRSTDEEWDAFKKESTVEEFATIELISEIFACRDDVLHRGKADLDGLADNLKNNIPLPGLDSHDVNWEILHAAWLTILVCQYVLRLASACTSKKEATLAPGVKKITDIANEALHTCIETLEVKKNICRARSEGDTLQRLTDNIINEAEYMGAFKDLVEEENWATKKLSGIVIIQENVILKALEGARVVLERTLKLQQDL